MRAAVLMSTYNGERYLKEQIESVLAQEMGDDDKLILYIRDDGSTDDTRRIIRSYTDDSENVICVDGSDALHLGIKDSFLSLLRTAEQDEYFDYYAFADQDDVWMCDKLSCAVSMLDGLHNEKGALYYSNEIIADEDLGNLHEERFPYYGDLTEILWTSRAYGNTMVIDGKLAGYVCRHSPRSSDYHDAWIYRLAKCIGSDIVFDENAHIYYRRHSENSFGLTGLHKNWLHMLKNFIPDLIRPRIHYFQDQVKEIYEYYREDLTPDAEDFMMTVMDYNRDLNAKLRLLKDPGMGKRPFSNRLIWIYKVIFNQL